VVPVAKVRPRNIDPEAVAKVAIQRRAKTVAGSRPRQVAARPRASSGPGGAIERPVDSRGQELRGDRSRDSRRRRVTPLALDSPVSRDHAPAMPHDSLVRAIALWNEANVLIQRSQRTRAEVHTARRRCPVRRHMRLAFGANDDDATVRPPAKRSWPEARTRRCPRCQSGDGGPLWRVITEDGLVKLYLWCDVCTLPFVFVHSSRD